MAASMSLSYLSMRFTQLVVMIAGTYFVLHGELSDGGFVSFLLLVGVFFRPVEKINAGAGDLPEGDRRVQALHRAARHRAGHRRRAGRDRRSRDLRGDIRYENVTFGYSPDAAGAARHRPRRSAPARRSPSSGRPAPARRRSRSLLPRFYEIDAGRITIDGIDIRDMTLASLRREIGIVQQDVFLFAGTIRENIAYGRLDATEAEIVEAARRAQAGRR